MIIMFYLFFSCWMDFIFFFVNDRYLRIKAFGECQQPVHVEYDRTADIGVILIESGCVWVFVDLRNCGSYLLYTVLEVIISW